MTEKVERVSEEAERLIAEFATAAAARSSAVRQTAHAALLSYIGKLEAEANLLALAKQRIADLELVVARLQGRRRKGARS